MAGFDRRLWVHPCRPKLSTYLCPGLLVVLSLAAPSAYGVFHLWDINEVYRNADGSVMYVELFTTAAGQQFLAGHELVSRDTGGNVVATFVFPSDSPAPTNNKNLLIGTSTLPAAAGVSTDFVLPAGFLNGSGGSVEIVGIGTDSMSFGAFPADRTESITDAGVGTATPRNFAGDQGTFFATLPLVSAVLPSSRSVQVDSTATAFATIINTDPAVATDCSIALTDGALGNFSYQTTNPATNAVTGTPDTPVDIAGSGSQSFVFAVTPTTPFQSVDVEFDFDCTSGSPAAVFSGLNTLLMSASLVPASTRC